MLEILYKISYVLCLIAFLICDIIFLILNKNDTNYHYGFSISGTILFIITITFGSFMVQDKNYYLGLFQIIFGIIGFIIQVTIGLVLKLSFDTYFLVPMIIISNICISTAISLMIFRCHEHF